MFEWLSVVPCILAGAIFVHNREFRTARTVAAVASSLAMLAALACLVGGGKTAETAVPASAGLTLVVTLVGFGACVASPLGTSAGTFSRTLLLCGTSAAMSLVRSSGALATLWGAEIVVILAELAFNVRTRGTARLCAAYLVPSALLAAAGTLLLARGESRTGGALWAVAISLRAGLFPFHSWVVPFVERGALGFVVAALSPQIGLLISLNLLTREQGVAMPMLASLGLVTGVLGTCLALVQKCARRAIGYVLLGQTGLVLVGLQGHGEVSTTALLSSWSAEAIAGAGLLLVLGGLEARRGRASVAEPSGSYDRVPLLASAFLVFGLSSAGLPGTYGFVTEELLLDATSTRPLTVVAVVFVTALASITVMRSFFFLFMGTRQHHGEGDLVQREWIALSALVGALVLAGLFPSAGIRLFPGASAHRAHTGSLVTLGAQLPGTLQGPTR